MKRGSIMFCPKCGAQVPDGSPFCSSCGAQMGQQQQAPTNQGGMNFSQIGNQFNPGDMMNDFKKNVTDFKSFGIPQFVALGGAVLFIVGMILPYMSVGIWGVKASASFFSSGAFHWLLGIVIALAGAFTAITKKGIPMIAAGAVAILFWLIEMIVNSTPLASWGVGFYFMLIAAIAICVGGVLQFLQDKKK